MHPNELNAGLARSLGVWRLLRTVSTNSQTQPQPLENTDLIGRTPAPWQTLESVAHSLRAPQHVYGSSTVDEQKDNNTMPSTDEEAAFLEDAWDLLGEALSMRYVPMDESSLEVPGLISTLKPHQCAGVRRLQLLEEKFNGALLGDDMGLGKTLQIIALILHQNSKSFTRAWSANTQAPYHVPQPYHVARNRGEYKPCNKPTLVVVEPNLVNTWKEDIRKHVDPNSFFFATFLNTPDSDSCHTYRMNEIEQFDLIITTYDTVRTQFKRLQTYIESSNLKLWNRSASIPVPADLEDFHATDAPSVLLYSINWHRVVLDEGQKIRGASNGSQIFRALTSPKLGDGSRIFVSGTPYLNYYRDLAAPFAFLRIKPFHNYHHFMKLFCRKEEGYNTTLEMDLSGIIHDFLKLSLECIMVRRLQKDYIDLPRLEEYIVRIKLNDDKIIDYYGPRPNPTTKKPPQLEVGVQDFVYNLLHDTNDRDTAPGGRAGGAEAAIRARQGATHWACHRAYVQKGMKNTSTIDPEWVTEMRKDGTWRSSKVGKAVDTICTHLAEDASLKVLVFEAHRPNVEVIGIGLEENGISFVKIHGGIPPRKRADDIDLFKKPGGPRVLVGTPKSIATGLNLFIASEVHILTPLYTPFEETQCIKRAHRQGQVEDVHVYKYIAHDSYDERVETNIQAPKLRQQMNLLTDGYERSIDFWEQTEKDKFDTALQQLMIRAGSGWWSFSLFDGDECPDFPSGGDDEDDYQSDTDSDTDSEPAASSFIELSDDDVPEASATGQSTKISKQGQKPTNDDSGAGPSGTKGKEAVTKPTSEATATPKPIDKTPTTRRGSLSSLNTPRFDPVLGRYVYKTPTTSKPTTRGPDPEMGDNEPETARSGDNQEEDDSDDLYSPSEKLSQSCGLRP